MLEPWAEISERLRRFHQIQSDPERPFGGLLNTPQIARIIFAATHEGR